MSKKGIEFVNKYKNAVIESTKGTNLFPSVKMAQMIIESGYGSSANARLANNFFGIKKGVGWKGQTIILNTPNDAKPKSEFRKYPNVQASVSDHSNFLKVNKRYTTNGVFIARTPEEQIRALVKAGYAESKNYYNALMDLINQYNLKELDKTSNISIAGVKNVLPYIIIALASLSIYKEIKML